MNDHQGETETVASADKNATATEHPISPVPATTPPHTTSSKGASRPRTALLATLAGILMMLVFGAWALASPVGASPDEDFHLASIWCGSGEREGLCGPGSHPHTRMVPDNIERATCYAHEATTDASCQGDQFMSGRFGLAESERVNGDSLYPSGYYFWTSLLAGNNMVVSVLTMRLAHALLFTVLSITLWLLLPRTDRVAYVSAMAATFVPFGLFLIPSINPSGWAIASAALLLPSLIGFFSATRPKSIVFAAFAVVAALLGLGARGDSAAYTVVAVLAALVLCLKTTRQYWVRAILPVGIAVVAVIAFFHANQTSSALNGEMAINGQKQVSKSVLTLIDAIDLPELFLAILGQNFDSSPYNGLGWLDTPMPALVWVPTTFVFAGLLFTGFARFDVRKTIALVGVGVASFAIPMYLLVKNGVTVGYQVQPRYIMPLLIVFVLVALLPNRNGTLTSPRLSTTQLVTAGTLVTVANSLALFTNMRRYVSPGNYNLNETQWWWSVGPQPMTVWCVGSAAFALLVAFAVWRARVSPLLATSK